MSTKLKLEEVEVLVSAVRQLAERGHTAQARIEQRALYRRVLQAIAWKECADPQGCADAVLELTDEDAEVSL